MTRPVTRLSVGGIARTLFMQHGWDWDAAYSAAYAYKWGVSTPRTSFQALSDMQKSNCVVLSKREIAAIEAAYRKVKIGHDDDQQHMVTA